MSIALQPVIPGRMRAPVLKLDASISFWGGVDFETGRIMDRSHPQLGEVLGGRCVVVPMIRGSGGTPGSLATLIKNDLAPACIVVGYPDINVMSGVFVADRLYSKRCPLYVASDAQLERFETHMTASIDPSGLAELSPAET